MQQPCAHLNNEPFDTLYPPPVFTFRLFRLGDNYSDTGGWREGDEQADRAWYACSPASELSGINGLGNGHPATDLINNAPVNLTR